MRLGLPVAIAILALSGNVALAGVVVTSTTTRLETKQTTPAMAYVDTDRMKIATGTTTIIYRGDLKKAWIINLAQKTYFEMTPETMQQLNARLAGIQAQLGAAQAQLQQRLATLPPAQRAQIEALMAGRGGAGALGAQSAAPPQVAYVKTGQTRTVAGIRCNVYHKTLDKEPDEDVCIAPIASAKLTAADFRVLEDFASFARPASSAPQLPRNDYMNWAAMNQAIGFQGFPLDTMHFDNGAPSREDTVQKIERANIPAGTFDLPPGLTQRSFGPPPR